MKTPISWLQDYVDLTGLTPDEIANKLIKSGTEVESIDTTAAALDPAFFVVAEVVTCEAHPDSDHLHVCSVDDGSGAPLQIVCGAPNCRAGLKTALARIGAVVPDGEFKIKPSKLRGVPSNGMLCSSRELKLGDDHSGIMELDASLKPGTPLATLLPKPETILDLEITWNRSDCLSIIGIARELAAVTGQKAKLPAVDFPEEGRDVNELAKVIVDDPEGCPRYTARVIEGVKDGPSPDWMAKRLEQAGMRSLGLIVDVTNYVMLECGQPLHAFDHTTLRDSTIIVRKAKQGETIKTLDGVDRKLEPWMTVIADADRASAIAGVMGGAESEIEGDTRTVLIESALFDAPSIKRTETHLGLHSESAHRYERSVDPDLADWASRRAVSLLVQYGGGKACKGVIDIDNRKPPRQPIKLSFNKARSLIGIDISDDEINAILTSLGIEVVESGEGWKTYKAPSYRVDLECDADLVEEIDRIYGLDNIPDISVASIAVPGADDLKFRAESFLREAVAAMGLSEAMHYSFLSKAELDAFNPDASKRLVLPNPVSGDYGVMRDSLMPQLLQSIGRNHARQIESPALFEIGRVFGVNAEGKPCEEKRIALGFSGPFGRDALNKRRPVANEEAMLWIKGIVEGVCAAMHAPEPRFEAEDFAPFEKGWSLVVRIGRDVAGRIGLAKESLRHPWRLHSPLAIAELAVAPVIMNYGNKRALKPIPQFPAVSRDIAIIAPDTLANGEIVKVIRKAAPQTLVSVTLFDVFKSKNLAGKASMAYALQFRSPDKTLTDDEVNAACQKIITTLRNKLGVEVRE